METPHEKVISGPGGMDRDEAMALVAKQFALERRGQHVYFEVPAGRGVAPVYAFAKSKGLTVLDVAGPRGGLLHVKCVDSP
jgi:catechol 2,3-dioxygenase-like lactoylglutathione lyase family enzyme